MQPNRAVSGANSAYGAGSGRTAWGQGSELNAQRHPPSLPPLRQILSLKLPVTWHIDVGGAL